ncbi:MAG: winged helix-turn-helix transcriptional regulator [Melioribacteraceae bacterium]|nr:MAG: winged helix-turn-helix transcriptional regulator [Melioribacteraceae bacterium]
MAKTKTENFSEEILHLADIAKALAHPARIKILQILTQKNMCITGELVDLLPIAQSTVSQHLNELKRVGLIQGETDGPKTCYCVNNKNMEEVKNKFTKLFTTICKC